MNKSLNVNADDEQVTLCVLNRVQLLCVRSLGLALILIYFFAVQPPGTHFTNMV